MTRLRERPWIEGKENPYNTDDGDEEELGNEELEDEDFDEDFDEDLDDGDEDLEEEEVEEDEEEAE